MKKSVSIIGLISSLIALASSLIIVFGAIFGNNNWLDTFERRHLLFLLIFINVFFIIASVCFVVIILKPEKYNLGDLCDSKNSEELKKRFRKFIKRYGKSIQGWGLINGDNNHFHFIVSIKKEQYLRISKKLPNKFEGVEIKTQKVIGTNFL
jgi:hypothetical protein